MWVKLALKLFSREFRRGELTVISAAIALAVLTVLTLSMVTERIGQSIAQKAVLLLQQTVYLQATMFWTPLLLLKHRAKI